MDQRADTIAGAPAVLTLEEVADQTGISQDEVLALWRCLGLPAPEEGAPAFNAADVEAITAAHEVVLYEVLGRDTETSLLRAVSHTTERLAWWQFETLVDDAAARYDLDVQSARLVVLDQVADLADILEDQMMYAWRKHLAGIIRSIGARIATAGSWPEEMRENFPLVRAVGFADMVGFTAASAGLGAAELDALVQRFTEQSRDIVAQGGGRIVKEMGDGIMFLTDEPVRGALIALAFAEELGANDDLPPVRVGLSWGQVLGRFGDVFGPTVNLASRLTDLAGRSQVWVDSRTAEVLEAEAPLRLVRLEQVAVEGVGLVRPYRLERRLGPD
ncbi:MAG: adenylate/guanylate cyclase domain-containing protein [Bifidobacteriaceae bacterium]|nr:adenylate/guanylate cyclase domain-containing protein [Bifidobacteriaceae bacterium]